MTHRDFHAEKKHGTSDGGAVPIEPTLEQLVEAREQVDAGLRLAFPQLHEQIAAGVQGAPADKKAVDHEIATEVGTKLLDARKAIMDAGVALPLDGQVDLHLAFSGLLNEIDRVTGELAQRWRSE